MQSTQGGRVDQSAQGTPAQTALLPGIINHNGKFGTVPFTASTLHVARFSDDLLLP
jgi:hypothetical protein